MASFRIYKMGKSKQQFMDLNRETAMRLWNKSFGKDTKAVDFAGRTIAKGAYNDRNSEFGWNVDHVLPQSRGGVTADHNLVCCHISTNDEKADKFPCFTANGIAFEIVKVQNHYEIRAKNKKKESVEETDSEELDFFDSASGIRFFKKLKGIQNKKRFVGTVFIRLRGLANTAVVDFIEELMSAEDISYKVDKYNNNDLIIIARDYNLPLKSDISELLDKCILLNTYFSYFVSDGCAKAYNIYYRVDYFEQKVLMYEQLDGLACPGIPYSHLLGRYGMRMILKSQTRCENTLFVNGLVLENTEAGEKVERECNSEYTEYNFIYTKLSENLKKEVGGK